MHAAGQKPGQHIFAPHRTAVFFYKIHTGRVGHHGIRHAVQKQQRRRGRCDIAFRRCPAAQLRGIFDQRAQENRIRTGRAAAVIAWLQPYGPKLFLRRAQPAAGVYGCHSLHSCAHSAFFTVYARLPFGQRRHQRKMPARRSRPKADKIRVQPPLRSLAAQVSKHRQHLSDLIRALFLLAAGARHAHISIAPFYRRVKARAQMHRAQAAEIPAAAGYTHQHRKRPLAFCGQVQVKFQLAALRPGAAQPQPLIGDIACIHPCIIAGNFSVVGHFLAPLGRRAACQPFLRSFCCKNAV